MTPFIVAELSANHLGSLNRAKKIIDEAAKAGADAIKLQTYKPEDMVAGSGLVSNGPWKGRVLRKLYEEAYTPWEWHRELFIYANNQGLIAFSSPFSKQAVDYLERIHCPMYKIASFELVDIPLIQYCASTKKPLIMSTGMANYSEITDAVSAAKEAGCRDLTLLKCTSGYPTPMSEVNLHAMQSLRCHGNAGISDHSLGSTVAIAATALGATMIEKHLTLSRKEGGPDAGFSSEPDEFAQMVRGVREARLCLGDGLIIPTESEKSQLMLRRSLYFSQTLKTGHVLKECDIKTARPARGLAPKFLDHVLNQPLCRDVLVDEPVTWGCF